MKFQATQFVVLVAPLLVAPGCAKLKKPEPMKVYETESASDSGEIVAKRYPELAKNAKQHHALAVEAQDDKEPELLAHNAKVAYLWWRAATTRSHADDLVSERKRLDDELSEFKRNLADAEKQEQLALAATGGSAVRDAINKALSAVKEAERVDARVHAKAKFVEAENKLSAATKALRDGDEKRAQSLALEAEAAADAARVEAEPRFASTQSDSERNAAQRALFKQLSGISGATAAIVEGGVMVTVAQSFESAGLEIKPETAGTYDKIAEAAAANPGISLVITGHTDTKGSASRNLQLSDSRAKSVMSYLAARGVEPARVTALGKGSDQPVANNNTKEGRARNRRIEILFSTPGA